MPTKKEELRIRRHIKIRSKVSGTTERPRLVVLRTLTHISAQIIDDTKGLTLVSSNDTKGKGTKTEKAVEVGKDLAKKAVEKKIEAVVFDRNGYKYHGRVKALADAAREGGLKF